MFTVVVGSLGMLLFVIAFFQTYGETIATKIMIVGTRVEWRGLVASLILRCRGMLLFVIAL